MISYIFASYFVMLFICLYFIVFDDEELKANFKWWVFSPITLPLFLFGLFINW